MTVVSVSPALKFNERPVGASVLAVVLHHTAGASAMSTIRYLWKPWIRASYHYIIEKDGTVFKCVPASKRAWHAGSSEGPGGHDVNSHTIGIAFANRGDGEAYTVAQRVACLELIEALKGQFKDLRYVTAHRLITRRKIDPFGFDFLDFAKGTGLEPWRDSRKVPWDG